MATDISKQERCIKAVKDLEGLVSLWLSGKVTHESAMERVREILKSVK